MPNDGSWEPGLASPNQARLSSPRAFMDLLSIAAKGKLIPTTVLLRRGETWQINLSSNLAWPHIGHITLQSPLWSQPWSSPLRMGITGTAQGNCEDHMS